MSFFSFLGKVANTVGHDVSTVAHGNSAPGGGVFGFLNQSAQQIVNPISKVANEGVALGQAVTGNLQGAQRTLTPGGGLGHQGGVLGGAETGPGAVFIGPNAGTNIAKTVGTGASIASNIVAPTFGFLQEGSLAARAAKGALFGSGVGAVGGVGAGLESGQVNPKQILLGAAGGAALGGLAPVAGAAVHQFATAPEIGAIGKDVAVPKPEDIHIPTNAGTIRISPDELNNLAKAQTPEAVKSIIGDALPQEITDRIAPGIALRKDPNIIQNIIAKGVNDTLPRPPAPVVGNEIAPPSVSEPVNPAGQGTSDLADKQRQFLETVQNSNTSTGDLQEAARKLNQTYQQKSNNELVKQAQAEVEKDHVGSLARVLSNESLSDKDVAVGQELMRKAQNDGTPEGIQQAVNIADALDTKLRESGRAVQAASIWNRLSPEGVLQLAAKKVGQARQLRKGVAKETPTAEDIKQTIENSVPQFDRGSVGQAVKEISGEQQKLNLGGLEGGSQAAENTGQQLAKNVERAALPEVKKKADVLVQELTKKVKQEYLEPKTVVKKSPLSILQEVFGRSAEADESYPLAQKILQDKYANVPQMKEALDKFFGSKLKLPAADTTINRAISDQLKTNGERVSDVIYKSLTTQEATVKNVAKDLVKEGFDQQSATKLAEEVAKRLNKQVSDAKISALQRLSQEAKPKAQSTYLDKINKLSNLNALDNEDYLHLARAKLNLPQLTPEIGQKIHDLSQNLQDLPEGHDKYALVRQIQSLVGSAIPKTKGQLFKEFLGLPRTILASGDFSFGARQGLVYATSHPIKFAKAWPKQFEYFKQGFAGKDSEAFDAMMADIRTHPDYHYLEKSPLSLTEPSGHSSSLREEQFISSDLAEKIPAIGRLVSASNYAYTGLGNYIRANEFYAQLEHLKYAGVPIDQEVIDGLGNWINHATGRGGLKGGFTEKHGGFLSTVAFAPRLIASRLNTFNINFYRNLPPPARQEALRGLLGLSAFATGVLGLAKLAGADVATDPRSSDFGKIRVGDTRFDVLGGFTQYIRLATQLTTGQKINSTTGAQTEAGKGVAGSRLDILSNFAQGKENPSVSLATTLLKGKDISGNSIYTPKGVSSQVMQRFIPLLAQDIADLASHPNSAGVASAIPGVFGVGLQTYGTQDEPISAKQQTYLQNLKKQGAPTDVINANNSFFQSLKIAAAKKSTASQSIDAAIKNQDLGKAQQLADQYNKELAAGMTKWAQQYGEQYGNSDLQEAYNRQKINLTPGSVQSRIKALTSNKPF